MTEDAALIADILIGDTHAMRRFVERYAGFIRSVIRGLGPRTNLYVNDLCNDVFAALSEGHFRALRMWRQQSSLKTYLYPIIRREALRRLDSYTGPGTAGETGEAPEEGIPDDAPSPEQLHSLTQLRDCVQRALGRLPQNYQQVIRLKELHGLDYSSIAAQLGTTINNVGVRLARARGRLRQTLLDTCRDHLAQLFPHTALPSG